MITEDTFSIIKSSILTVIIQLFISDEMLQYFIVQHILYASITYFVEKKD